jgi:hypothetical protein
MNSTSDIARFLLPGRFLAVVGLLLLGGGCAVDPADTGSSQDNGQSVVANKIHGSVGEWFVDVSAGRAKEGQWFSRLPILALFSMSFW